MSTREDCYAALLTGGTLAKASRKLRFLSEVANSDLPALFMQVDRQIVVQKPGTPTRRTLNALVYLYAFNPDPTLPASPVLNDLIDAVEAAIAPAPGAQLQTLGGVVAHAWIDGAVEVYEAAKDQRAAAVLTIAMMMP